MSIKEINSKKKTYNFPKTPAHSAISKALYDWVGVAGSTRPIDVNKYNWDHIRVINTGCMVSNNHFRVVEEADAWSVRVHCKDGTFYLQEFY